MKKDLLFLAFTLALAAGHTLQAKNGVCVAGAADTDFFGTNAVVTPSTTPGTTNAATIVGPHVVVRKLRFYPNVSSGAAATTVQVWDMPGTALTYTAGAKLITTLYGLQPNVTTGAYEIDFRKSTGLDATQMNSSDNGQEFVYYPALVTSGTNTVNAQADYSPWFPLNKVQGVAGN